MSSSNILNRAEYLDRLSGCWSGKNIGGTLGAPMEGKRDFFDVHFYTQDLSGKPAPNDDLDLQLIYLLAVEEQGIFHLNERLLAEYWMCYITGPWNEYGVAKSNIANGLLPPLSGAFNNEAWKNSNGAWIRSEIWAALFPGDPDEALKFAWYDACVDHSGEGIYAELFTVALESAAYVEQNVMELIRIALSKIPENSRTAECVRCAVDEFQKGSSLKTARDAVLARRGQFGHPQWDGYFQAPAHIGFVVLALLYGGGDFSKTVCAAVNCGDDTDCTAATAGSVMGILLGRSGIPDEWMAPIGETIQTIAVKRYRAHIPETLSELVARTAACRELLQMEHSGLLVRIEDAETRVNPEWNTICAGSEKAERIWKMCDGKTLTFDFPWGRLMISYEEGPVMEPSATQRISLRLFSRFHDSVPVRLQWMLPEEWDISPSREQELVLMAQLQSSSSFQITSGSFRDSVLAFIPVKIELSGRKNPWMITVPFQCRGGCVCGHDDGFPPEREELIGRIDARRSALQKKG